MNSASKFFFVVLLLTAIITCMNATNPLEEIQILYESDHYGVSVDVSDKNEFLVIGNNDDKLYIFSEKSNGKGF